LFCLCISMGVSDLSSNFHRYEDGARRVVVATQALMDELRLPLHDPIARIAAEFLSALKGILGLATSYSLYWSAQAGGTLIFVCFLLVSPIKSTQEVTQPVMQDVFHYISLKAIISACIGVTIFICCLALDIGSPVLLGLLHFIANFIPTVGPAAACVVICILTLFDASKSVADVGTVLFVQVMVHSAFGVLEPTVFGASSDLHPVVVVLGVTGFGYVWGVAGMLVAVPAMSAVRLVVKSYVKQDSVLSGEGRFTLKLVEHMLEGKWMKQHEPVLEGDLGFYMREKSETFAPGMSMMSFLEPVDQEHEEDSERGAAGCGRYCAPMFDAMQGHRDKMSAVYRHHAQYFKGAGILFFSLLVFDAFGFFSS